ncbi:MAG: LysR family transcriptional regulator [Burkholderiales bacterium]|nr:LysR family transcriptional regulator [Burkholderiales bacterium]
MDRFSAMECYVRVVDTGSFSAAARQLGIGQPAVSKTIKQLEDTLGVKLLVRSTRGLATTEAGQSYYERVKRVMEDADEADLAARGAGTSLTGRLRICAAVTFARIHLIPHLQPFLDAHPDLELDIVLDDRNIDLVQEGIDIALRMGELPSSSLTARLIARSQRLVMGTPAYFARAGVPASPADLAMHQAIIYRKGGSGSGNAWTFRQTTSTVEVTAKGRIYISAAEGIRAAVLADMGLTLAPAWMFAPELAEGRVQAVLIDWALPPIDLWAVFPTGRVATAKARLFASFVEGLLAKNAVTIPVGNKS